MKRVSVSLSDDVENKLRDYCEKTGASMSSVMGIAIATYMDQQEVIKMMPEMLVALGRLEGEKDYLKLVEESKK